MVTVKYFYGALYFYDIKNPYHKVDINFTIDKHLYEQFKRVPQKDM